MSTLPFETNPTQVAGLLAFAASTLTCAWAARRRSDARWHWLWLAALHALLWIDTLLNMRHHLHDLANQALLAAGWYGSRVWLQAALLAVLLAFAMLAWRARPRAGLAWSATFMLMALLLLELISWHQSDRVLYARIGPLLLIAYGWIAAAAVVVSSALRAR